MTCVWVVCCGVQVMGDSSPDADKLMRSQGASAGLPKPLALVLRSSSPQPAPPLRQFASALRFFVGPSLSVIFTFTCLADSITSSFSLLPTAGVRALPSFHFFKSGERVDSISGAKTQALQVAIENYM